MVLVYFFLQLQILLVAQVHEASGHSRDFLIQASLFHQRNLQVTIGADCRYLIVSNF